MKKRLLTLLTCCCIAMSGCETASINSEYTMPPTDEYAWIYDNEAGENRMIDTLPYDMNYNGNTIVFDSVELFEGPSSSGYGYTIYAVATIDVSNLDEKDLYWLDQDFGHVYGTFQINAYIRDNSNDLDFESMMLGHSVYGDKRMYAFTLLEECKQPFNNAEVTVSISIEQDETYNYEAQDGHVSEQNKHNEYQYTAEAQGGSAIKGIDSMAKDLLKSISRGDTFNP